MKKTINKQVLKNWIKHTDSQNRVWEESEMWKQRKLEMEAEDKKTDRRTDKRRKENPPSQKSGEYVSGYWNKKLMELKEKDTSRWGHSGYKELYPEEFSNEPAKKSAKQDRQGKKRHHDSSDSDSVDVSSRRRNANQPCKESIDEKHKKHKKSKQKDAAPTIRNDREKSPRSRSISPNKVRKSVKDKSSKLSHESKKLSSEKYKRDSLNHDIREKSHDSGPERVEGKSGRSRKRVKASPPVDEDSPKKSTKKGKEDLTLQDRSLSSRAAEIRREIEELENSVDMKKSKKSHDKAPDDHKKSEEVSVELKSKKHKKKKQSSHDKEKDRLLEEDEESRVHHKSSETVLESKSRGRRRDKSAKEDTADRDESKRKKSSKSKQNESLPDRKSEKRLDSKESEKNLSRPKEVENKSEKKSNSKTSSRSQDIDDEAERLRELAKKSMRSKSSRHSAVKERDGDKISDEIPSVQHSEKEDVESKNGYKRLKFKKDESPKKDRSPSSSPEKKTSKSPKRRKSPVPKQKRKSSPKHGRSPTLPSQPVSDMKVSKALEDVRDPMEDFPESPSDDASFSEGEIVRTKEKKSHKKKKKDKKKKDKKKKKKSSRSKDVEKPAGEFSLEVSDNFGLCDSVLAFDEIGDLD